MKLFITFSYFFAAVAHCAASKEEQASAGHHSPPKFRIRAGVADEVLPKTAIKREQGKKDARQAETPLTSRERISRYTQEKQMFFILDSSNDPVPLLYEDPSKETLHLNYILWFCAPSHASDTNGDGMVDSLVAHTVSFIPNAQAQIKNGATGTGMWMSRGYTASWSDEAGYYDEYVADFDDSSVFHIKGSSVNGYETSPAGGRGGMVMAGEGEWTFDTNHPMLLDMAAMGLDGAELSYEVCAEKYAAVWTEKNQPNRSD